ncbi:MAG: hypothetical protein IH872_10560 [Chloroflexi bacterium]|nr:hypothetical protein [Chloroflexota bacterium]
MAQHTTIAPEPEIEDNAATIAVCRHHWVIQPADGPVSKGACQICGETREFKNYVESATWGDSRIASKNSVASVGVGSTSDDADDQDTNGAPESADEEVGAEV